MRQWTKTDQRPGRIAFEASGLAWLAEAGPHGAKVVRVLESSPTRLLEEHLVSAPPTRTAAEDFGRALARTHAAGGLAPRGAAARLHGRRMDGRSAAPPPR